MKRLWAEAVLIPVLQALHSKVVAVYFGAQFCQPCQQFKPNLLTVRF
jgi:thioredoxin-like negative regulator of GroEL